MIKYNDFQFLKELVPAIPFFNRLNQKIYTVSFEDENSLGGFAFVDDGNGVFQGLCYGRGNWLSDELIQKAQAYARDELKAVKIYSRCNIANKKSIAVAQKTGMTIVKTGSDYVLLEVTRQ